MKTFLFIVEMKQFFHFIIFVVMKRLCHFKTPSFEALKRLDCMKSQIFSLVGHENAVEALRWLVDTVRVFESR